MNILMTGGTGFVGKKLAKKLVQKNHKIFVVTRSKAKYLGVLPFPCELIEWKELPKILSLLNIDAVIHLAGESVAQKTWTSKVKREIHDSRVKTTRQLVNAFEKIPLKTFISASAIGYYGDRGEEILNEKSTASKNFLGKVCVDWELEVEHIRTMQPGVRVAILRTGIVLGEEGALTQMAPLFQNGFGGALADGKMWMSWIHIDDLVEMYVWAVENPSVSGIYNAVSPNPTRNIDFSDVLVKIFNKKLFLSVPRLILKTALGEMSQVILASQNVQPEHALREKFQFQYFDLETALRSVLEPLAPYEKKVIFEQWLPLSRQKLFPYFQNEKNLEELTPPSLHFRVLNKSTPEIQKGTLINYKLKIFGLPVHWQSLILDWRPGEYFIDTQTKGPYEKWHHTHEFEPLAGGTVVRDIVRYKMSMGALGKLFAGPKVDGDIKKIFDYRAKKIREIIKSWQTL